MNQETRAARLAVIDLQNVFADPGSPWFAPDLPGILDPVRRLAAAFGDRTTFTRFIAPDEPVGAWRPYYAQWPFALQPPDSDIYRLVDEFAADAGPTVDATTFSKWTPRLAGLVGGAGRLVLAGVATDCCVLSTAVAAADAGVAVQVVADACAGSSREAHQQALGILRLYAPLIEVVGLEDILGPAAVTRRGVSRQESVRRDGRT
jgi:nicotinamidase-related amidase